MLAVPLVEEEKTESGSVGIDRLEFQNYVEVAKEISNRDGWGDLAFSMYGNAALASLSGDSRMEEVFKYNGNAAVFTREYLRAYFRGGKFFKASITIEDIISKVPEIEDLPPEVRERLDEIIKDIDAKLTYGSIKEEGFTTRSGGSYMIPPIQLTASPFADKKVVISEVDHKQIGNDILRVIIEAQFDAYSMLPAVASATGANAERFCKKQSQPLLNFADEGLRAQVYGDAIDDEEFWGSYEMGQSSGRVFHDSVEQSHSRRRTLGH